MRGLETLAIWNQDDKTFTLHSPTLTAAKWWIGTLGRTANYAVVMAQLVIDGKPYGPHPFVCQIRDLKTHQELENIHIGDIGPKFGFKWVEGRTYYHVIMLMILQHNGQWLRPVQQGQDSACQHAGQVSD